MTRNVIASTSGMAIATTSPARSPRLMKLIASTMTTASNSAARKPDTASSTTAGWSETRYTSTPIGSSAMILSISLSSAAPNSSRLAPAFMPMASPIAGLPLKRNRLSGGSTIAAPDRRDIRQREEAVVDAQIDRLAGSPRR